MVLGEDLLRGEPLDLTFAKHGHGLIALDGALRRAEDLKPQPRVYTAFQKPMILLHWCVRESCPRICTVGSSALLILLAKSCLRGMSRPTNRVCKRMPPLNSLESDFAISITFGESELKAVTGSSDARPYQAIPARISPSHRGIKKRAGCGRRGTYTRRNPIRACPRSPTSWPDFPRAEG